MNWPIITALLLVSAALGVIGLELAPRVTIVALGVGAILVATALVAAHRYPGRLW